MAVEFSHVRRVSSIPIPILPICMACRMAWCMALWEKAVSFKLFLLGKTGVSPSFTTAPCCSDAAEKSMGKYPSRRCFWWPKTVSKSESYKGKIQFILVTCCLAFFFIFVWKCMAKNRPGTLLVVAVGDAVVEIEPQAMAVLSVDGLHSGLCPPTPPKGHRPIGECKPQIPGRSFHESWLVRRGSFT